MKSNRKNRRMNFESMEKRELFAADLGMDLATVSDSSPALGTAEIEFVEVAGESAGQPVCYLKYKLDRAFVKSWSTSGDADDRPTEEVAFHFDQSSEAHDMKWDNVKNLPSSTGEPTESTLRANDEDGDQEAKGGNAETTWKVEKGEKFAEETNPILDVRATTESGEQEAKGGNAETTWKVEKGEKFADETNPILDVRATTESGEQEAKGGNAETTWKVEKGEKFAAEASWKVEEGVKYAVETEAAIHGNSPGTADIDFVEVGEAPGSGEDAFFVKVDSETTTQAAVDPNSIDQVMRFWG